MPQRLCAARSSGSETRILIVLSLVDALLEKLGDHGFEESAVEVSQVPDEIFETLTAKRTTIAEIARLIGYSREGFIRRFARETGMTPHAYRLAHQASRARGLLSQHAAIREPFLTC